MEKNRIVLFNILKKRTKCILQGLQDNNSNLVRDVRDLLQGISGISDEELESIETVDDFWDILVKKNVISKDDLQVLESVAGFVKSEELEREVKEYEKKSTGMVQKVDSETCLSVLKDVTKGAVIILKAVFKTAAQTAAVTGTIACVVKLFHNNPEVLQTMFSNILPYGMDLIGLKKGSLYFWLETSSLSSLKQLWKSYEDGSLEKKFKKVINEIDEVRRLTQGTEIDVTVEIDEEEYREACWVLVLAKIIEQAEVDQESSQRVQRPRRHSLSCERDFLPMRDKTLLSWREGTALKEAENKLAKEIRRRRYVEKQVEELRQEIEVLKGAKDAVSKSKIEDIKALEEQNQELIIELETPKTTDVKTVEKIKKAIEDNEEMLKAAVGADDRVVAGAAYIKTGILYSTLGTIYKETNRKENWEDTMKKAESCFREAADHWEKLNAQLNNEDELKSVVNRSLFVTYEFLTTVLMATKQTEEALIVSDCTRDRDLVDNMIEKFQMNKNEILSESMRYGNVSSVLENKGFSILILAVRDTNINIWTLECQKPSCFLTITLPKELEWKTSAHSYIGYDEETLEQLYELLIAPVLSNLTQDDLVIIADGPLHLVPFAALRNPKTGQFLSDIKCIRYAPSLTAMKVWKECPVDYHGNTGALIVGDPDVGKVVFGGKELEHGRLPSAQIEAMAISRLLDTIPMTGSQATKDEVLTRLRHHLTVIHIAAMANKRGDILLAPSASTREVKVPEEQDYLLTVEEVQEICIRAKLVVLSVSNSGYGEITMGKVNSMSRAFLAAGARAVVASLWAIYDKATLGFMLSFYASLKMGESASKSLQIAMSDIREEEGYEDPKYWAPFFLIGDDVTISVHEQ